MFVAAEHCCHLSYHPPDMCHSVSTVCGPIEYRQPDLNLHQLVMQAMLLIVENLGTGFVLWRHAAGVKYRL